MALTPAGSRRKGARAEREVLTILRDLLGDHIVRARGEGANDHGDITGVPSCAIQVKNLTNTVVALREGLEGVAEQKANAKLPWGAVWIRRRGGKYVVVMSPEDWMSMYREAALR